MRLAVEISTCSTGRTGIGYYTEHLVDALLATRAPTDEIILINNGKPAPELFERWSPWLRIGGVPVRSLWMQRDAGRMLVEAGADFAVFPNYLAPLIVPCPFVNVVHDLAIIRMPGFFDLPKLALQRPLLPMVVRQAAAVGTVSQASRRDVVSLLGVPEHRILMLPGAPHPACRPPTEAEVARVRRRHGLERPYVLSVGTLEPRKNLPMLLRAFDRLLARTGTPAANVDLVVVGGRGWRDRELLAEIARRSSTGRLHTLGYVDEKDLVALYGGAEVFAYPSHFEGFGLPVIEAMACGTPVVATDVEALREVSGGAAVLVPLGEETALVDAIAAFIDDPSSRPAARARGLARAATFRWEDTADRLWTFARAHARPRARAPIHPGPTGAESEGARIPVVDAGTMIGSPPMRSPVPVAVASEDDPAWAILSTVVYADMFDAPVSVEEAARTCLGARLSPADVRGQVTAPPLSGLLTLDATDHITLRGREELVGRRADGVRRTAELLDRHQRVIAGLASLPFVRMLALSGGTAHRNARGGDDIDLFVVAAAGRAYTAYTMLSLASMLTRRRGILCPNYLVDEGHLQIAYHHDLFTAHQAISLVPIAGIDTFARFVEANEGWVRAFYPSYVPRPPGGALGSRRLQRAGERALAWSLGDEIERLLSRGLEISSQRAGGAGAAAGSRARSWNPQAAPVGSPAEGPGALRAAAGAVPPELGRARAPVGRIDDDHDIRVKVARAATAGDIGPAAICLSALLVPLVYAPALDSPFSAPKLALLLLAGAFGIGGAMLAMAAGGARPRRSLPIRLALLAVLVATASSAIFAASRRPPGAPYAGVELLRLLAMLGVAAGAAQAAEDPDWRRRLVGGIHVSAGVVSLIGLLQHVHLLPFVIPVISVPGSTFGNRNMAAEAVALSLPFGLAALGLGQRPPTGSDAVRPRLWLAWALLVAELVYLAVTRARGAWLGGALGAIAFFAVRRPQLPRTARLVALPLGLVVALAALLPGRWVPHDSLDVKRYQSGPRVVLEALDPAAHTTRTRVGLWRRTLALYSEHPLTGIGPGNFQVLFPLRAEPGATADGVMSATMVPRRPHDDLLERLAETGPFGLAAWLALAFAALGAAVAWWRAGRAHPVDGGDVTRLDGAAAAAGCVAAGFACGLTAFPLAMPATTLLFGVGLGMLSGNRGTLEGFLKPPAMGSDEQSSSDDNTGTLEGFLKPPAMGSDEQSSSSPTRSSGGLAMVGGAMVLTVVLGATAGWLAMRGLVTSYWVGRAERTRGAGALPLLARAERTAIGPDRFAVALRTAQMALRAGLSAEAAAAADRALDVEPYSPHARASRAAARLAAGDASGAADDARAALALYGDYPGALFTLVEASSKLGRAEEAEATRAHLSELASGNRDARNLLDLLPKGH